ncbi:hypothetical protein BH23BAC1_BH23BAC1_19220 [soil metagenome]
MENIINWFIIPSLDYQRAKDFYSSLLNYELTEVTEAGSTFSHFPFNGQNVSGSILPPEKNHLPSTQGARIYLNIDHSLSDILKKTEPLGGKVNSNPIKVGTGYLAEIVDL